jgi:hypothetical protein
VSRDTLRDANGAIGEWGLVNGIRFVGRGGRTAKPDLEAFLLQLEFSFAFIVRELCGNLNEVLLRLERLVRAPGEQDGCFG